MSTVLLCPGQGAQYAGMGLAGYRASEAARKVYERADAQVGYALSQLCFEGPAEQLNKTEFTQPAVFVTTLALWAAVQGSYPAPVFVMGHSLGELTALVVAGALEFSAGLGLVVRRAQLMAQAGAIHPGGMAVLLGSTLAAAEALCVAVRHQSGEVLVVANDNCPGQVVISGGAAALDLAVHLARDYGVRQIRRLPVSVAPHSPLMAQAEADFAVLLEQVEWHIPTVPVVLNATAMLTQDPAAIREALLRQLTAPVRWRESLLAVAAKGADHFVDSGPQQVLAGLTRRTLPQAQVEALDRTAEL